LECGADENGNIAEPDVDPVTGYEEGLVTVPKDFKVRFTPSSEGRKETILKEFKKAEIEIFSQYEG
jgi:hypothetical protein